MLKLMFITNDPKVAKIAENAGVDRIFVDMEYIGKAERQCGLDTVLNHHTPQDVKRIKSIITTAEVMVIINPWYEGSRDEIENVIEAGAEAIMLPYFKTLNEVKAFINTINSRAKTVLLLETQEAVELLDELIELQGIDEIHIGINDLCISQGKKFMFELLTDGTVEKICKKIETTDIPYGIGGIASLGRGILPSDYIIKEHYRLGSSMAILSRSFCNIKAIQDYDAIASQFDIGIKAIRAFERYLEKVDRNSQLLLDNLAEMTEIVNTIRGAI